MITETTLIDLIEDYTKEHKCMPTRICGSFMQLQCIAHFSSYGGDYKYHTVLGSLFTHLDTEASEVYVDREPAQNTRTKIPLSKRPPIF
jgi:hypothetical protein